MAQDQTGNGGWLVVPVPLNDYRVVKVKVWVAQGGGQSAGYIAVDAVGLDVQPEDRYEHNGFNQLLSVTGSDGSSAYFGYDGNGNETRKTETSGSGTVSTTTYAYDGDNRLVGIQLPGGVTNAFECDVNGLRTKKTDSSGTTRYLLDGLSVVAQYATDGTRQAWYTQSLARIDEVLSVVNDSGKYWYQADALGSVYGLSNQAGVLVGNQDYDVFGAPVPALTGPMGQPFGFTGREHELDTGLTYHRDRYMQAAFGRWTQADRIASPVWGSDAATTLAAQMPTQAWHFTASVGAAVAARTAQSHPYRYSVAPTLRVDPSGFAECGEDWLGAPLVYAEVELGPLAIVLFGGVYTGLNTGHQVGVVEILGEGGLWGDGPKGFFDPLESVTTLQIGPFHTQMGFGFGEEHGLRGVNDFKDGGLSFERVYQFGPFVWVFGKQQGWAWFVASGLQIGVGGLVGWDATTWAWSMG